MQNISASLWDMDKQELEEYLRSHGAAKFRTGQICRQLYKNFECDPERMTDLPKDLQAQLKADFGSSLPVEVTEIFKSPRDKTRKLLLRLCDNETVEMVMIPSKERMTFCLSTQVGCPVGCRFCASGENGLRRNLTTGEIIGQFLAGVRENGNALPDNIVFMGIGEGLLNFDNLADALEKLSGADFFGMSPRRITVSTSGFVPGIEKLAALRKEYTLAVSLHAPDDATRAKLIPDKLRYPVAEILSAAAMYCEKAGRMVTIEYTLIKGINDTQEHARELAHLARQNRMKVNLIAMNSTFREYRRPERHVIDEFLKTVLSITPHATLRLSKGSDISGACGQLRRKAASSK